MEPAPVFESTLRVYYRCDQVVRGTLEGEIVWYGPSEPRFLVIETNPREFLTQHHLLYILKKQIFGSLKQQPFVQELLTEGDSLGMAQWEILYHHDMSWLWGITAMDVNHLHDNIAIAIQEDFYGPYAELWITATLVINSQDVTHLVPPQTTELIFLPPYRYGDSGEANASDAARFPKI